MKMFLLIITSLMIAFTYSCGGDEKKEEKEENCVTNSDCAIKEICDLEKKECVATTTTNALTSLEVDIDGAADTKKYSMLVGFDKTVIAYGIYDNDETEIEDLSSKVRWYSSNRDVGVTKMSSDGQTVKFISKAPGKAEVYCKYLSFESDHVVFNVTEAIINKISLSSKSGDSIYLHQGIKWDIIADFDGGTQGVLNPEDLSFTSSPEGIYKDGENGYKFPSVGTYEVSVSKDGITSNTLSIEVKENVVTNIKLVSNLEDGDFILNTPHRVTVSELLEGDGEVVLENTTGITWLVKIKTGEDTHEAAVEGADYSIEDFSFTFKKVGTFSVTASKDYGENTFTAERSFSVKDAK